jgi:hypothetical protein
MRKILLFFCALLVSNMGMHSQELSDKSPHKWIKFLHIESGFIYPKGTIKDNISIRQNISSNYVDQSSNGNISSETSGLLFGARWEYFNTKFKVGVSTGIRYTGYRSEITGSSSINAKFFYLRYSMEGSDTKFARVKSLTERNNYISIPLELKWVPLQYKNVGFFAKAGMDVSILNLSNGTRVNFQESNMNIHQDVVLRGIETITNKFSSSLYSSLGMKFGKENKPNYSIEFFLPSLFLNKNNFNLADIDYLEGFKISIQFSIKK